MIEYISSTAFDKDLQLTIREENTGRMTNFEYSGFDGLEQAIAFASWWEDCWGFGYSGYAEAIEKDGKYLVEAERYNSCD